MDEVSKERISLLYPDYLGLMMTYQTIEDYVFQIVYLVNKDERGIQNRELKSVSFQNLYEMRPAFFHYAFPYFGTKEFGAFKNAYKELTRRRNFYVHDFMGKLYLDCLDEEGELTPEFEDYDFALQDDLQAAHDFYQLCIEKIGPHRHKKKRNVSLSPLTLSRTHVQLSPQQSGPAYASSRGEAFPALFWNLSYLYSLVETALYALIQLLDDRYHFLDEENHDKLGAKTLGDLGKFFFLGLKDNYDVHLILDDCIPDARRLSAELRDLQFDRNYWLHFCWIEVKPKERPQALENPAFCNQALQSQESLQQTLSTLQQIQQRLKKRLQK